MQTLGAQLGSVAMLPGRVLIVARGWEEGRPLTHEIQAAFDLRVGGFVPEPQLLVRYWTERDR